MIHRYCSQHENAISEDKRSLSHCKFANKSTPKTFLCLDDQHVSHSQLERCIADVQNLVQLDEGNRGIAGILPCGTVGSLLKAAECMDESQSVAIITGFPCMIDYVPPTETDGPLGALSLARTLLYLGKDVVILTDECNEEVLLACGAASGLMSHHTSSNNNSTSDGTDSTSYTNKKVLKMESFPSKNEMDEREMHRLMSIAASVDLVIAIERTGPNFEGKYLTMRGRDMSHLVCPLDILFSLPRDADKCGQDGSDCAQSMRRLRTIGIGDGGNEVGMGAVYEAVAGSQRIPNAATIACTVPADYLIVASVSNWGGYALSGATAMVSCYRENKSPSGLLDVQMLRNHLRMCLPSDEEEIRMCERMVLAGARDGITGENAAKVDGMPLERSLQ
eukprot:gene30966-40295_t